MKFLAGEPTPKGIVAIIESLCPSTITEQLNHMTPFARRSAALVAALTLAVGAAGCGGGGDSADTSTAAATTAALSIDQFRTQADAICGEYKGKLDALAAPSSPAEVGPFFDKAVPLYKEEVSKLKALAAPAELKPTFETTLGLLDQVVGEVEGAQQRIAKGEDAQTVITEIDSKVTDLNKQADEKAREMGLKVCGDDETSTSTTGTDTTATTATTADVTSTTAGADTSGTDTAIAPGSTVDLATFVGDVQKFAQTLTQFGLTLQAAADGPDALKKRSALLRSQLDEFDAATTRMGSYTVDSPEFEKRRAAIVAASPDISRLGRELLTAAENQDAAGVQRVAKEMTTALERLRSAASGG